MTPQNSGLKIFTLSLQQIAKNYALRCDAKSADTHVLRFEEKTRAAGYFELGELLPLPFTKGIQPDYVDQPNEDTVPVVNTLSIQNLSLRVEDCRHITRDDFDAISAERKPAKGDVLLTVDGGVSIGKPYLFDRKQDFTIDSHVVVLRPRGVSPLALVYLLASPMGQMQFGRAESGASGQTTVTEDDIRRFIFPRSILKTIDILAKELEAERKRIAKARKALDGEEAKIWARLEDLVK